jgi:hypothetical protein
MMKTKTLLAALGLMVSPLAAAGPLELEVDDTLYAIEFHAALISDVYADTDFTAPGYAELADSVSIAMVDYFNEIGFFANNIPGCTVRPELCILFTADNFIPDSPAHNGEDVFSMALSPHYSQYNFDTTGSYWVPKQVVPIGNGFLSTVDFSDEHRRSFFTFEETVPVPGTLMLLCVGLLGLRLSRTQRKPYYCGGC